MTSEQKADIKLLIAVYEEHGADWSLALEYTVRKYNGSLPKQEWDAYRKPRRGKNDTR